MKSRYQCIVHNRLKSILWVTLISQLSCTTIVSAEEVTGIDLRQQDVKEKSFNDSMMNDGVLVPGERLQGIMDDPRIKINPVKNTNIKGDPGAEF